MAVKKSLDFVRTTAIGGLLVIVPISVILFVLGSLIYQLYDFGLALIENPRTPSVIVENPIIVMLVAVGTIVGVCFTTGLIVRTSVGNAAKQWFNTRVAARVPVLKALTTLTERFAGVEGHQFSPVEVFVHSNDVASIGFLVEELPDNRAAVFVPTAPMATVGNVYIVPQSRIRRLDASVSDAIGTVTQWGVEAGSLYKQA